MYVSMGTCDAMINALKLIVSSCNGFG